MDYQTIYINPDIKLSCFSGRLFKTEVLFEHHMLVWFISGETKIIQADTTYIFGAGDTFLIPRNLLATIINYPKDGLPHKAVAMYLSESRLKEFYAKNKVEGKPAHLHTIRGFGRHPLLESCLASLIPYFKLKETLPENIASIKIEEAISVLRSIDNNIDCLLANFEHPGKINLTDFMEKNYMFNMTMAKFGYLTGRSLTTFKRDFKRTFHTTPQKWLTQKRLELAHYRIREQNGRPSEVYIEVGFENLSHFTYAFKKHFGYAPTGCSSMAIYKHPMVRYAQHRIPELKTTSTEDKATIMDPAQIKAIIDHVYSSFNKRDLAEILPLMHPNVHWPNGWEGGFVEGRGGVKDYWTRQWNTINPKVDPLTIDRMEDGRVKVFVQQTVKDLQGNLISNNAITHIYTFEDGLIKTMEIHPNG